MNNRIQTPFAMLAVIVLSMLAGCKSNNGLIKCPELTTSGSKTHEKIWAHNYHRPDHAKALKTEVPDNKSASVKPQTATLTASADKSVPIQIKLPSMLMNKVDGDDGLNQMNSVLNNYSADKVSLVRKDNGKIYLTAGSAKDLVVLTSNISKDMKPRGYYEKRYGGGGGGDGSGAAIAAGVLGPIGFVFAFIPFLDIAAIPICIAAIVTGAVGLRSHRRGLAAAGLALGVLGLIIALLTIWIYLTLLPILIFL